LSWIASSSSSRISRSLSQSYSYSYSCNSSLLFRIYSILILIILIILIIKSLIKPNLNIMSIERLLDQGGLEFEPLLYSHCWNRYPSYLSFKSDLAPFSPIIRRY